MFLNDGEYLSLFQFLIAWVPQIIILPDMNIDWSQAPKNARWWAVDENGQANWFSVPHVAPFTNFWFFELTPAPTFGFKGDWRKCLTERPASSAK